ncbi:MAG: hypothetical protein IJV68_05125 [Clostridia bacterium]|nr:hypothetical protein [Clostridia bacterium]
MKKILSCFLSAIILTGVVALTIFFSGCSDEEKAVAGDGKILYAWTGSYTAEQHNNAIFEYFDSCEAIEWTNEKGLHIKIDFKATNARMRVFIPQVLSDISTQVHSEYYTAPIISNGNDILVDLGWYFKADEEIQKNTLWSYLVIVTDEAGELHNYYFRVNYKNPDTNFDPSVIHSVKYDIDGDGKEDECQLISKTENGENIRAFAVKDVGTKETKIYHIIKNGELPKNIYFITDEEGNLFIEGYNDSDVNVMKAPKRFEIIIEDGAVSFEMVQYVYYP